MFKVSIRLCHSIAPNESCSLGPAGFRWMSSLNPSLPIGCERIVAAVPPRRGGTYQPRASPSDHHQPTLLHTLKGLHSKCTCAAWSDFYITLLALRRSPYGKAITFPKGTPSGRDRV